jgi:anti-sigma regulatory factor (Ser/Thr protein kinase)
VGYRITGTGNGADSRTNLLTEEARLKVSVEAKASELAQIRRAVAELVKELGADEEAVARIAIAVNEACSNVVSHAYGDDEAGTVEVEAWAGERDVVFSIRDSGTPLAQRPAGSTDAGLGVYLIASLSDDCELRNPEEGGNEILLGFRLNGDERLHVIRKVLPESR